MSKEIWEDVKGWPYQVSNFGRVRRVRYLDPQECVGGYLRVEMNSGDRTQRFLVHRLVASVFHGPCPDGKAHAAHKDGNPKNNRPENLYWATAAENNADRKRHGRVPSGSGAPHAKLTDDDAKIIRARYHLARETTAELSRLFGVSRNVIKRVISNNGYNSAGGYGI